jgi:hypothetical protein
MHDNSAVTTSVGCPGSPLPSKGVIAAIVFVLITVVPGIALADEGGISFWIPGFFGSLAATPAQPGWSGTSIYYHDSVSAGGDVARAREFQIRNIPVNFTGAVTANVNASVNLDLFAVTYTFATPVLGAQASFSLLSAYGANSTSLAGTLAGTLTGPLGGVVAFSRSDAINSTIVGFGDVLPMFQLKWNAGVNNYMFYATGDMPAGAYDSMRLANIGIGHWAFDTGFGYTYFDQPAGREASAVLGFTYNFINPATQYQNGVDMHLDWGVSQFLTKQWQVGLVGYLYQELGCDSGSGDRVGCFRSRVVGVGPQVGYIFPLGDKLQGYLNLKAYGEFANENRPAGWNLWLTFNLSPAAATPPTPARPMFTK